jgi:pyrroline-5-carboxylate reductase
MQLGFIGTGEITASIVTGLRSFGSASDIIQLSPRNPTIAAKLANRFKGICVASCNQEVLEHSDIIVIAVRPPAARSVLSELRFRPNHQVISLVSALSLRSLSELVAPATKTTRAVPLPSSAKGLSPTAIFPPDRVAYDVFTALGTVFEVEREKEFDAMCATTASIASYLAFTERIASWLAEQGIRESKAREYIARLFLGVTTTAVGTAEGSFQSLVTNHATVGGINEQFLKHLVQHGLLTSVSEALDAILQRISAESQMPSIGATV